MIKRVHSLNNTTNRYFSMIRAALLVTVLAVSLSGIVAQDSANPETSAPGQVPARVVVVLDASGSMWGQVDGTAKITIAKNVLNEVMDQWNPDQAIGLIAYGHRRKGDCSDIEILIPVAPFDRDRFNAAIDGIQPRGKTPLTAAVRMAAEALKYEEQRATVILLSDGLETCNEDPCAAARELEQTGIDFTAHVIGFGLEKDENLASLKCIAEETGGNFLTADTAQMLKESFEQTVRDVKTLRSNVHFTGVNTAGDAVPVDRWRVFRDDGRGAIPEAMTADTRVFQSYASEIETYLEPGAYVVEAVRSKVSVVKTFTVPETEPVDVRVEMPLQGTVILKAVTEPGGAPFRPGRWEVFPGGADVNDPSERLFNTYTETPELTLMPGPYRVRVTYKKDVRVQDFDVAAGSRSDVEVVMAEQAEITIRVVESAGGESVDPKNWEILTTVPEDSTETPTRVYRGYGKDEVRKLLPGTYEIVVEYGESSARQIFTVTAGEVRDLEVVLPRQGMVDIRAVYAPGGDSQKLQKWEIWTTVPPDGAAKPERVIQGYNSGETRLLMPGTYRLDVRYEKAKASREFTVEPGQKTLAEIVIPKQGILALDASDAAGHPVKAQKYTVYTVVPPDSTDTPQRIERKYGSTAEIYLLPGEYTVTVHVNDTEYTDTVTIEPGQRTVHTFVVE